MKPSLLIVFFFVTASCYTAAAQTIEEQMTKSHPTCRDVFQNAVEVLPKLYKHNAFDSMHAALKIWATACGESPEIQYTNLLLDIQESNFKSDSAGNNLVDLLQNYAGNFSFYKSAATPYYQLQKSFYTFSSVWAKLLMESKKLTEDEQLICAVLKGDITNPTKEITSHPDTYPVLYAKIQQQQLSARKQFRRTTAFLMGTWMPNSDLNILGNHPSLGVSFGGRGNSQELDFVLQFRFIKSANPYTFMRNNTLYETRHFFGGYIGIDYSWYFLSRQRSELGLLTGIGYDGFDVSNSNTNKNLSPNSVGSLNANGGLKYNWYINPNFYLGLQARYNLVNYCNTAATSFKGNAVSIDFIIGGSNLVSGRPYY